MPFDTWPWTVWVNLGTLAFVIANTIWVLTYVRRQFKRIATSWKELSEHGEKLKEEWLKVMAWRAVMESRGIRIEGPEVDLSSVTKH